jgi:spectinomycin phosphotransferase
MKAFRRNPLLIPLMEFGTPFEKSCMIEKPNISDEKIVSAVENHYSIPIASIEFLPVGNDASAFAYGVKAKNQTAYFLKLKKGISNLAGLFVPRFLKDNEIEQVIAPLPTKTQGLMQDG